jgi:hypothetical protein
MIMKKDEIYDRRFPWKLCKGMAQISKLQKHVTPSEEIERRWGFLSKYKRSDDVMGDGYHDIRGLCLSDCLFTVDDGVVNGYKKKLF